MIQKTIIEQMKVKPRINLDEELDHRIQFIKQLMLDAGVHYLVLGISGGVDSSTAGRISQLAVEQLRQQSGEDYRFVAVRLPHNIQLDEDDAQQALQFIQPDEVVTVNIGQAVNILKDTVDKAMAEINCPHHSAAHEDFVKGNVKARIRMVAQYNIANKLGGLVVGTDHSAEAIMGFYTKHGDGAVDLAPLFGLNKRQVRALCQHLGANKAIYNKPATADLEELDPQALDEDRLGVSYQSIDDFLEGKMIEQSHQNKIIEQFKRTQHKRSSVPVPGFNQDSMK